MRLLFDNSRARSLGIPAAEIQTIDLGKPLIAARGEPYDLGAGFLEAAQIVFIVKMKRVVPRESNSA